MTSSNGTFSALLAICVGNSPVSGEFPAQRPVTRSFDVFFDLCPNKRLGTQSWGWWFETLSCPLWRHSNGQACIMSGPSPWNMYINIYENIMICQWLYLPMAVLKSGSQWCLTILCFHYFRVCSRCFDLWPGNFSRIDFGLHKFLATKFTEIFWDTCSFLSNRKSAYLMKRCFFFHVAETEERIYASQPMPSLVQIMTRRLIGAKPLYEPMLEYC